jgi:hypothetical protein
MRFNLESERLVMSETFGIELEVSNLSITGAQHAINRAGLNWQVKFDGTRHVSAEAVSPILDRDRLNEAKKATRALLASGATVNKQTGLHVHLGADEYGTEGIARLVWNWNLAHATIGALVAKSRLNNHFCQSVHLANLDSWVENVRNGNIRNAEGGRYWSLNLNAYSAHRTVEFRLHHGTLNGSKVKAWAEFVSAMATYSTAGNLLSTNDGWHNPIDRLNKVGELLDTLAHAGNLSGDTAEYLKGRAEELSAR